MTLCGNLSQVCSQHVYAFCAAYSQGMKCVITYTSSTQGEDFYGEGADAKVPDLGSRKVMLESIFGPMKESGVDAELLVGIKDPKQ